MGLADTAKLVVDLSLTGNFLSQTAKVNKAVSGLDTALSKTEGRAYRAGQQIGTGIKRGAVIAAGAVGLLASQVALGLRSLEKLEGVTTQTNAVLKSTKGVAGETADSIRNLAEKYEALNATVGDEVIQSGENLLLTFTNIRKDAFEPALAAALDLNQALGRGEEGLDGTVRALGRALNDPAKGLVQLTRLGITFTDEQKKQIDAALATNDTFKAQGIILEELNKRFGGSFLAGGTTTAGKVAKFKDAIEDLQRALATALLPTIGKVADALTKFLADPKVVAEVGKLGEKIASLFSDKNLAEGGKFLQDAFNTAKQAAPIIEASAQATFKIVQAAVGLFKSLPEGLQQLAVGAFAVNKLTGGLVTNVAGGLFDTVKDLILKQRGATPANPLFVADVANDVGALAGAGGVGSNLTGLAGKVGSIVTKVAIVGIAAEVASMLIGPIQDLGTGIHQFVFGDRGDPLSDFGKAWSDWRKNADWPFGQKNAPEWAGGKPTPTGPTQADIDKMARAIVNAQAGNATPKTFIGSDQFPGKEKDDRDIVGATLKLMVNEFKNINHALRTGSKSEVKNAIAEAMKLIGGGRGNAKTTEGVLASLKTALKNTHDPKLQESLRAAIGKVERVLPGRQFAAKQLAKADAVLRSSESSGRKIRDLQAIEKSLRDRGLPAAAKSIGAKVEAAKREQVYATHAATQAIKDKDLSVTVPVNVTNRVSVGDIVRTQTTFAKFGKYQS